jgi:putative flippase GtrA
MNWFKSLFTGHYGKIFRYLVAGGISTFVDLAALYLFTSVFHIWYLISAILAFLIAFGVSFALQKFWTFADKSTENIRKQMVIYFLVAGINLGLNTVLMYLFVDLADFHYLWAQIIVTALIACESFFVYQKFIFKISSAEV